MNDASSETNVLFGEAQSALDVGEFGRSIATLERIERRWRGDRSEDATAYVAAARVMRGVAVGRGGELAQAVNLFEDIVSEFGADHRPQVRAHVAGALVNRALALAALKRPEEAIRAFEVVLERFGDDQLAQVRGEVAIALDHEATLLVEQGQLVRADEVMGELVRRFADDPDEGLRTRAESALAIIARMLWDTGAFENGITLLAELIRRFTPDRYSDAVATALVSHGISLGQAGRPAEALEAFDAVIERYGRATALPVRITVANARYNKAIAHREAGRYAAAVAALNEVLDTTAGTDDASLRRQAAIAGFNKGIVLLKSGHPDQALAAFEDVVNDYGEDEEETTRVRVAYSLYNRGRALIRLARLDEAEASWRELAARSGKDAATADIGAAALADADALAAMRTRPHHVWGNVFDRGLEEQMRREETRGAHDPSVMREYRDLQREYLERADQFAGARHDAAVRVLWEYRKSASPFVLFLRNFDLEAYIATSRRSGEEPVTVVLGGQRPSAVEEAVAQALADVVPVIGVANPANTITDPTLLDRDISVMPKLELHGDRWSQAVDELIRVAAFIVVELAVSTPGVALELELIRKHKRQESTVIILADQEQDPLSQGLRQFYAIPDATHMTFTPTSAELSDFRRIGAHTDIPYRALIESQLFRDLLLNVRDRAET